MKKKKKKKKKRRKKAGAFREQRSPASRLRGSFRFFLVHLLPGGVVEIVVEIVADDFHVIVIVVDDFHVIVIVVDDFFAPPVSASALLLPLKGRVFVFVLFCFWRKTLILIFSSFRRCFFFEEEEKKKTGGLMLEEAKIVSFDVGLRVYTRTRTRERERERSIQREKDSERNGAKERRRRTSRLSLWPVSKKVG